MPDPADIERQKLSPQGQKLREHLADREWRLDSLYQIRAENGDKIRFVRNEAQRAFCETAWCRNVIAKSRKLGFSTFIAIDILDECLFHSGTTAGVVDRSLDDAVDKLTMIKFAYDNMPGELGADLRHARPLVKANEKELTWSNGSTVTVGTSYRGGTPSLLHVSEFGKISVDSPETAKEIITGAVQAVPASGRVWVESTAHGTAGLFYDMVQRSRQAADRKQPLTSLDFKLNFYGWWIKQEYRLPNNLVVVPHDLREYFDILRQKHHIALDHDQRAWYAKKYEELGPDSMKSEYPSEIGELFYSSVEGAYWKIEINKARREGRIGQMVPHDPTRPVNTAWDIGEDCTAIWFHQTDGVRHRLIDYWEEEGSSLQAACGVVDEKRKERSFVYGKHYGPHDLDNRDWANNAQSRKQVADGLGVKFEVVPRVAVKADAIEAGRRLLNLAWIDSDNCGVGLSRLENYRKRWNKQLGVFSSDPIHDLASHGSDAVQQLAMGLKPDKPERDRNDDRRFRDKPKSSGWAA
jgi:hypothetical protein